MKLSKLSGLALKWIQKQFKEHPVIAIIVVWIVAILLAVFVLGMPVERFLEELVRAPG